MGRHFIAALDRNPVILSRKQYDQWVNERFKKAVDLGIVFRKEENAKAYAKIMEEITGVRCLVLPTELIEGTRKKENVCGDS